MTQLELYRHLANSFYGMPHPMEEPDFASAYPSSVRKYIDTDIAVTSDICWRINENERRTNMGNQSKTAQRIGYMVHEKMYEFMPVNYFKIYRVIFNNPATIVFWADGTKTVVKAQKGDKFDPEKGLAMAITKRALGDQGNYYNVFRKHLLKQKKRIRKTAVKKAVKKEG